MGLMGIFAVSDAFAALGLWLPSACPGRSADLCRTTFLDIANHIHMVINVGAQSAVGAQYFAPLQATNVIEY